MNIRNYGTIIGRVTRDPKVFTNRDGSRKILMTIAVRDNFKTKNEVQTQFVPVEGFLGKAMKGLGVYERIHQGDMIGVHYSVRTNTFTKDGVTEYKTVLAIQDVDLMELKSVTDKRLAARANGAAEMQPAPEADGGIVDDELMPAEMVDDAPFDENAIV